MRGEGASNVVRFAWHFPSIISAIQKILELILEVTLKISNGIGKIRMYGEVFKNINTNCSRIQR